VLVYLHSIFSTETKQTTNAMYGKVIHRRYLGHTGVAQVQIFNTGGSHDKNT
jgi:hypothetical protein